MSGACPEVSYRALVLLLTRFDLGRVLGLLTREPLACARLNLCFGVPYRLHGIRSFQDVIELVRLSCWQFIFV